MSAAAAPRLDPGSLIRTRQYRALLVLAAVVGVLVCLASWGPLEAHDTDELITSFG